MVKEDAIERDATTAVSEVAIEPTSLPAVGDAIRRLESIRQFISQSLNPQLRDAEEQAKKAGGQLDARTRSRLEVDYGTIPGQSRPFLKQPGAEKICFWLRVVPDDSDTKETELGDGQLEVVGVVKLTDGQGRVLGRATASASTRESNYAYRWLAPPKDEIPPFDEQQRMKIRGEGKVVPRKTGATVTEWVFLGRYPNPNIWDERNKVRQIARKRALVKAVRTYAAMSDIFVEDPAEWGYFDEEEQETRTAPATQTVVSGETEGKATHKPEPKAEPAKAEPKRRFASAALSGDGKAYVVGDLPVDATDWIRRVTTGGYDPNRKCQWMPDAFFADFQGLCEEWGVECVEFKTWDEALKAVGARATHNGVGEATPKSDTRAGMPPEQKQQGSPEGQEAVAEPGVSEITAKVASVETARSGKPLVTAKGNKYGVLMTTNPARRLYVFDLKILESLANAVGKQVVLWAKHSDRGYDHVERLLQVGDTTYGEDGMPEFDLEA